MTDNKKRFLELFTAKAGNISELCKAIGVSRQAYYNWMKEDEKFKTAVEDAQESLIDFAESKLLNLIDEKNVTAIIFFLKTN